MPFLPSLAYTGYGKGDDKIPRSDCQQCQEHHEEHVCLWDQVRGRQLAQPRGIPAMLSAMYVACNAIYIVPSV